MAGVSDALSVWALSRDDGRCESAVVGCGCDRPVCSSLQLPPLVRCPRRSWVSGTRTRTNSRRRTSWRRKQAFADHPSYCQLRPRRRRPRATRHAPRATRHAPRATRHAPRATRHAPRATRHAPRATRHAPRATRHAPRATRNAQRATRNAQRATTGHPSQKRADELNKLEKAHQQLEIIKSLAATNSRPRHHGPEQRATGSLARRITSSICICDASLSNPTP